VATGVASEKSLAVDGLVLITPWNNLPDLAQSIYWFLPAKWLVKDRFDNAANLRDCNQPVAVLMADADEIIQISRRVRSMTRFALPSACGSSKIPATTPGPFRLERDGGGK